MDLQKAIRELYEEKERIEGVIASLEQYLRTNGAVVAAKRKRGRKSMSPEERQEVSARMRNYWASRRDSSPDSSSVPES
ncbi:MAG TPA: hypothetical protein VFQ91_01205 [Bryobacteraceae bacterium]|nr:hypothetical protein [Bryobacteraceae bacterium]